MSTTTYSFTSPINKVQATNPPVVTLNYTNNIEIDTTKSTSVSGSGLSSPIFFGNLSAETLAKMSGLASAALAAHGQATIQYQLVSSGTAPSGSPVTNQVIVSLSYDGHTVHA